MSSANPATVTIQVVLDPRLLSAADRAARRGRQNRSALIREALREHLRQLAAAEAELRDRTGYERQPDVEFAGWEKVAAWPRR